MPDATPLSVGGATRPRADRGVLRGAIVNGPVHSRRLGVSLGLNLLAAGSTLCTCDCPYWECGDNTPRVPGSRWPSPDEVTHALRRALERLRATPEWITFSGNGEPTLHPRFPVVVERVLGVRRRTRAPSPRRRAVRRTGDRGPRPARRARHARRARRPHHETRSRTARTGEGVRSDVNRLVASSRSLKRSTIQAMVPRGEDGDGSGPESMAAWLGLLARGEPDAVQRYALARAPADPALQKITRERLAEMARAIRRTLPRCVVEAF